MQFKKVAGEWRTIFDAIPDFISIHDIKYRVIMGNRALADSLGLKPEELIGKHCYELFHRTHEPLHHCPHRRTLETRETCREEVFQPVSGLHLDVVTSPVFDEKGQLTGTVHIARDITKQKQAQKALEESERKYRQLVETIHEGIWVIDKDATTTFVNLRMAEMLGYTVEEMMGHHLFSCMSENSIDIAITNIERRQMGIKEQHDFEFLRKDGTPVYVIMETSPMFDENGIYAGAIAGVQDITWRKMAEEELIRSERKYRDLADQLPQIVFGLDGNGRITFVNSQAYELTGYTPDDFARGLSVIQMVAPEDQDRLKANMEAILRGDKPSENEYRIMRKDGSMFPTMAYYTPVTNGGEVIGVEGLVIDITEQKRLDQLKDDFIGMVSHELRTPLTTIVGSVNMVLRGGNRLSQRESRKLLKDAAMSSEDLSNILANLLELSREKAGLLVMHMEMVDVRKAVRNALKELKVRTKAHEFVMSIPGCTPVVSADPLRLERILHNLLENAVKYSPHGGEIRVSVEKADTELVISISDQGIGIFQDDQVRIFDPFHRMEEIRTTGLGLGLLVCLRLVEAHHGRIWVESTKGHGSTFSFTLPLHSQ